MNSIIIKMMSFSSWFYSEEFVFGIRKYAVCILLGIALACFFGLKEARRIGVSREQLSTAALICIPLCIIGARAYYVLFSLDSYSSFGEMIAIWNGGLAIHGAIITALVFAILYCRKKTHMNIFKVSDLVAPGFLIGQILGRWGNFFNQEAHGTLMSESTANILTKIIPNFIMKNMYFSDYVDGISYTGYWHPTFLYEGLLNFALLLFILISMHKKIKIQHGDYIGFYITWYGIVRGIAIEPFRTDPLMINLFGMELRQNVLISAIFIVAGIVYIILKRIFFKQKYYYETVNEIKENRIDTILFDFDGTLANTFPLIKQSFIHTFAKFFPDKVLTDEELNSFMGPPLDVSFGKYTDNKEMISEMIEYYRKHNAMHHDELIKKYSDAEYVVSKLKHYGYNIAVVSSKKNETVRNGLKATKLDKYFDLIIGYEDVENFKPNPEGINKALEYFPFHKNVLYVGDADIDILAGKNAQVKTALMAYSINFEQALAQNPDYVCNTLTDLLIELGE